MTKKDDSDKKVKREAKKVDDRDFNCDVRCPVCRMQLRPVVDARGPRFLCKCKGWDK